LEAQPIGGNTVSRCRFALLAVLSTTLLGVPAAGALGATTIGSTLTAVPNTGFSGSSITFVQSVPEGRSFVSPIDGVLVRWRALNLFGTARPRVLRSTDGGATFIGAGTGPTITDASGSGVVPRSILPGLPIRAGDLFGVDQLSNLAISLHTSFSAEVNVFNPVLADSDPPRSQAPAMYELLANADVEGDRDKDHYGDETQDACPNQGGAHASPCGSISLSNVKALKKGKVRVTATVSGAGTLLGGAATDPGLRAQISKHTPPLKENEATRTDYSPGEITLVLKPTTVTKAKLRSKGKVKLRVKALFRPKDGGAAVSATAKVKLKS
jgi:hypothetical protein